MSTKNAISIAIPEAEQQTIKDAAGTLKKTLNPYLVALSNEQRQTIPKMGDGTQPFVRKTLAYAESNPEFAPPYMDLPELKKDMDVVRQLTPVLRTLEQLVSNLNDTLMLAGSESFVTSLSYYHTVKIAAKMNIPGAKSIYEDLRERFEKSSSGKSDATE